ncbi:hypothetical protein [Nonomuraea sp. NPDC050786]|uniref:hypothetical protein n=1 Tax=Nonomuraea sp. NPDC050786 TaxID=3154840 RepID=UPI0033D2DB18
MPEVAGVQGDGLLVADLRQIAGFAVGCRGQHAGFGRDVGSSLPGVGQVDRRGADRPYLRRRSFSSASTRTGGKVVRSRVMDGFLPVSWSYREALAGCAAVPHNRPRRTLQHSVLRLIHSFQRRDEVAKVLVGDSAEFADLDALELAGTEKEVDLSRPMLSISATCLSVYACIRIPLSFVVVRLSSFAGPPRTVAGYGL